jgi:polyisoprenoid-binding protein YceI
MALAEGTHALGPDNASLYVKTYREGMAAKVGHDLVIEVTRWDATVDLAGGAIALHADPRSLEVRSGERGVKPLTDKDRNEIRGTIDGKILRGQPIEFRSSSVHQDAGAGALAVEGELTMAGTTRPVSARMEVAADGHVTGTIPLTQSTWGIKPYRGLMGALKVRDEIEVEIAANLGAS